MRSIALWKCPDPNCGTTHHEPKPRKISGTRKHVIICDPGCRGIFDLSRKRLGVFLNGNPIYDKRRSDGNRKKSRRRLK
jgi:hypothetical protein